MMSTDDSKKNKKKKSSDGDDNPLMSLELQDDYAVKEVEAILESARQYEAEHKKLPEWAKVDAFRPGIPLIRCVGEKGLPTTKTRAVIGWIRKVFKPEWVKFHSIPNIIGLKMANGDTWYLAEMEIQAWLLFLHRHGLVVPFSTPTGEDME